MGDFRPKIEKKNGIEKKKKIEKRGLLGSEKCSFFISYFVKHTWNHNISCIQYTSC